MKIVDFGPSCPVCNRPLPAGPGRKGCSCGWRPRGSALPAIAAALALMALAAVWLLWPAAEDPEQGSRELVAQETADPGAVRGGGAAVAVRAPELTGTPGAGSAGQAGAVPPGPGSGRSAPSAAELLQLARKLVAEGALQQALGLYRKVIQLDPDSVDAHLELGLLCGDLGDSACFRAELERVLELQPANEEALRHLAHLYLQEGRTQPAVDAYRKLLRANPRDAAASLDLAKTLDAAGRYDEASVAYRSFLNRFHDEPGAAEASKRYEELIRPEEDKPKRRAFKVPIVRSGSALLVVGEVERAKQVRFLLDTGSTLTIISTELAEELGIDLRPDRNRYVRLETASGTVEAPLVMLDTVRLGKAVARNVEAAVFDVQAVDDIDGLLGLSFLDRFRFSIDVKRGVMLLEPR